MAARHDGAHDRTMEPTTHTAPRHEALRRANDGRLVAGVCAGLADYFDVDVVFVRVVVAALTVVAGVGLPLYLAAWLLVPDEASDESVAERLLGDVRWQTRRAPSEMHDYRGGHVGGSPDAQAS